MAVRLPALGRRGEGWVVGQIAVLGLLAATGLRGSAWPPGWGSWRTAAALVTAVAGLGLALAAALRLGRHLTPLPAPADGGALRDGGVYALCRHPMYGGVLLLCLAWAFATSPVALGPVALAAVFLEVKRRVEERWLQERYPGYGAYRRRVRRRMIPYLW